MINNQFNEQMSAAKKFMAHKGWSLIEGTENISSRGFNFFAKNENGDKIFVTFNARFDWNDNARFPYDSMLKEKRNFNFAVKSDVPSFIVEASKGCKRFIMAKVDEFVPTENKANGFDNVELKNPNNRVENILGEHVEIIFTVKYSDWKNRYQPAGFVSVKGSYNPETKKIAVYHDSGLEQMLADQLEYETNLEFGGISFEVDSRPVIKIETKTVSWKEWYSKWAAFGFKIIDKDSTGVTFEMDNSKLAKKTKAEAAANAKAEAEVEDWCAGIEF